MQPAAARALCGRLSAVLDTPVRIDWHEISGSFTVGASIYPQDGADIDTLDANAEAALYRAKVEQRGTIRFFEPAMDRQIREKRSLQQDIATAREKNELALHFQPQATTGGEVFGFEVLVRWHHPVRGTVSPSLFIPLAEETGAISAIDRWVLREACLEAASWPNPLSIAINLSPVDFRRGDITETILAVLLETGLQPHRLEIEITEGVLIEDFDRAIATLRRIKNLGVRIAMDDFGTGYSSLSYLQAFPFDKIKIDQSFITFLPIRFPSRPELHRQDRQAFSGGGDHPRRSGSRPNAGAARHRRGRRDRGATGLPGERRLRRGSGLSDRTATADRLLPPGHR